jgi:hypothetical protein
MSVTGSAPSRLLLAVASSCSSDANLLRILGSRRRERRRGIVTVMCDLPVSEQSGAGRPAVYCSRRCRSAAERDRMARRLVLGQMVEQRMRRGQPDE